LICGFTLKLRETPMGIAIEVILIHAEKVIHRVDTRLKSNAPSEVISGPHVVIFGTWDAARTHSESNVAMLGWCKCDACPSRRHKQ
jgi:hypothetical protein